MENSKNTKNNTTTQRRSIKYKKLEEEIAKEIDKDKEEEIIIKYKKKNETQKNKTINENEKNNKNDKDNKSKVIKHNHNYNKNNSRKDKTSVINIKRENGDDMSKKRKKKKIKLDSNSIIFLGIILFVATLIFIKTMGILMASITVVGIISIILLSMLLKKIRKNKIMRIITNIFTVMFLLICIAGICGIAYFAYIIVTEAPEWNTKKLNTKETSILYTTDGEKYAELGTEKRELITYEEASENLINAIIAVEDSRYFQHNGFDVLRFFKAGVGQVLGQSDAGGASTISMQVIKNTFTDGKLASMNSSGIKRKFTDIYLAVFKLEKEYSKEAILEFYINNHFLGSNSYGVEQASQTYFGKSAKDLTLAEASLIAGMFQAPTSYNPFTNPEEATSRRNEVLNLMYNHGYITDQERTLANSIPVESLLADVENTEYTQYQSYIDTVIDELDEKYGLNPYNTSLKVYTNIDLKKQSGLDNIFKGETFKWENDVVQAGIAAIDVWTGKITAIAGSRKSDARVLNFAKDTKKQVGSTAKPVFDYAPAMEYNGYSTYTIINDSKHSYSNGQIIRNSDRRYMGNITLKTALAESRNIPALKAFQAVDNDKIYEFVTGLGITPETTQGSTFVHEAHSIGSFTGSNPLEMAAAYAAFANGGIYYEPYTISKIVYRDTGETFEAEPNGNRVMSEATAFMITHCLEYTVTNGLAKGIAMNGTHLAAKTGTTNFTSETANFYNLPDTAVNDAWIVGYDPDTAVGMWYGYEKIYKQETKKRTCSTDAHFLKSATSGCKINIITERNGLYKAASKVLFTSNGKEFKEPNTVVKVAIEKGSNPAKLASSATPQNKITYEYFAKGTEPKEISTAYIKLKNVTNLKANYDILTGNVNLSWNAAKPNSDFDESYGKFGYKIYFNNSYIGFTEDTNYTISNNQNPVGTYKVITTYDTYSDTDSSGATVTIGEEQTDNSVYTSDNNFKTTYDVGEIISDCLTNGTVRNSCMTLYQDGTKVSDNYTIKVTITDSNNNKVTIDPTKAASYTATFKIDYKNKTRINKVLTITINEKVE